MKNLNMKFLRYNHKRYSLPLFFAIMTMFFALFSTPVKAESVIQVDIYLFGQSTCLHCRAEKEFLDEYTAENTSVIYHYFDILESEENAVLLEQIGAALNIPISSTPLTVIGSQYVSGFIEGTTDDEIMRIVSFYQSNPTRYRSIVGELIGDQAIGVIDDDGYQNTTFTIPLLGQIEAKDVSLPLLAIVMGTLDGFNPCAMWALLFLMSMLFNLEDKRKVWILGLTFLIASAVMYFSFMVAWLKMATYLSSYRLIQWLIAGVAFIGGIVNLRKYSQKRNEEEGCEVIDDKQRKKMFRRVLKITNQKVFLLAILGTVILAFSVNLFELLCSAGFPMIFTQILSMNQLSGFENLLYMLLYMLFYLIDDIIVFGIGMWTMKLTGFSTKYSKWSHLIGGMLMILIAVLMIFKPEWLRLSFSLIIPGLF